MNYLNAVISYKLQQNLQKHREVHRSVLPVRSLQGSIRRPFQRTLHDKRRSVEIFKGDPEGVYEKLILLQKWLPKVSEVVWHPYVYTQGVRFQVFVLYPTL